MANLFELYDTSDNVWEWTGSKWKDQFDGQEQQCARLEDFSTKTVRGGSWAYGPKYIRSSTRGELNAYPGILILLYLKMKMHIYAGFFPVYL